MSLDPLGQGPIFSSVLDYIWTDDQEHNALSERSVSEEGIVKREFDRSKAREILEAFAGYLFSIESNTDLKKYVHMKIQQMVGIKFKAKKWNQQGALLHGSTFQLHRHIQFTVNVNIMKARHQRKELLVQLSNMIPPLRNN